MRLNNTRVSFKINEMGFLFDGEPLNSQSGSVYFFSPFFQLLLFLNRGRNWKKEMYFAQGTRNLNLPHSYKTYVSRFYFALWYRRYVFTLLCSLFYSLPVGRTRE
jgi:hypothetical protein